ncbi:M12 family metallopeptidase [Pedobacter sp. AW1-32]|uniref:M12 family metallopeptidase n=1 Tax=Pedobacter sp. AW1-32 TaxID=3383026 RepID=UPI003FF02394
MVNMQQQASVGILIHELGLALGLFPEQTRLDRDQHVVINWNNIDAAFQYNFYKYDATSRQNGTSVSGTDYGLFDSWSIMMYPSNAFAIDPNVPTITDLLGNTFQPKLVIYHRQM